MQYNVYAPNSATTINGQRICRTVTPFAGNTQFKVNGSYPLPAGFMVSATYQNVPGPAYLANYAAPTAAILPSLGRNLSGGTRTANVPLIAPQTLREDRRTQLDLRVSKILQFGRSRLRTSISSTR